MKSLLISIAVLSLATRGAAAYAGRDLIVPIAGRTLGADGRAYLTALWITNPGETPADVALTFHPADETRPALSSALQLAAGETRLLDPYDPGGEGGTGWIRIESRAQLLVTSRLYSRMRTDPNARSIGGMFAAMPARFAIGNAEATTLQGVTPADSRYKLYFDEIAGQPLEVWVTLLDLGGRTVGRTHLYIDANRQVVKDPAALFPNFAQGAAVLRVEGMHGRGRVIVAGTAIAKETQDASGFEMSFIPESRDRIGFAEAAAYVAVAGAVIAAVVLRRRR